MRKSSIFKCFAARFNSLLIAAIHQKYIVLSNGKCSWCVQRHILCEKTGDIYETKFFKLLNKEELLEIALHRQNEELEKLKRENQSLKEQLYMLKHTY